MPDFMDHVQERVLQQQQEQVDAIQRRMVGGLSKCIDCGDGISELRRHLGAKHCIRCQEAIEARARR